MRRLSGPSNAVRLCLRLWEWAKAIGRVAALGRARWLAKPRAASERRVPQQTADDWRAGGLRVRGCAGSVWEGVGSSSSSSTQHDAEGGSGGEGERKRVAAVVWCGVGEGWCR